MKILFTGGGTAGHIFPIIAIIREIKKIYLKENLQFFYLGPKDEFGEVLLQQEGVVVKTILAGKIRRYFGFLSFFQNLIDIFIKFPLGFLQSLFYIFFISPDVIFSKGGYGSLPVVLVGWLFLTPIFLHESDVVPGLANRIASRFALEIFVSFPVEKTRYFPVKKMLLVGNPIRKEILEGKREKAKTLFNITGEKPVIMVLGGSQGSQRINDVLMIILSQLLEKFELIHQTGEKNFQEIQKETQIILNKELLRYYHPLAFLNEEELKHAYLISDLICSRAGAGAIFEIAGLGKPSILIPLSESAQNHQIENAYAYSEAGACLVLEEINLTPHFFLERIEYLFSQPQKLKEMSQAAESFAKPEAGRIIAEYLLTYLTQ